MIEVTLGGSYKNTQQTVCSDPTATPAAPGCPGSTSYNAAHPTVAVMIPPTVGSLQGYAQIDHLATAAGVYANGTQVTYSAGMKYTNKGTNPQGQILITINRPDGVYYVKSNSITSVAFTNLVNGVNKDVTIYTKASIFKIDATGKTISIDGSVTLRMDAHDGGTTGGDTVGFTVLSSKDGSLYYSNNWVWDNPTLSYKTVQQAVTTSIAGEAAVIN